MMTTISLDTTIPLWGLAIAFCTGAFYSVKMHFEMNALKKEMVDLKEDVNAELKDLKQLIHELILKK